MAYDEIKQELLKLKEALEQRLVKTEKHIKHEDGPLSADFEEQAVERQNDEVIYGLDEAARAELIQIRRALERVENGEYGLCRECGTEIPYERLEAIPYTDYCRDCVEKDVHENR